MATSKRENKKCKDELHVDACLEFWAQDLTGFDQSSLKMWRILAFFLTALVSRSLQSECPSYFSRVGDLCLKMVEEKMNFTAASDNCIGMGARLTTPTTEVLYENLMAWKKLDEIRPRVTVWLGASNIGQNDLSRYVWHNDEGKTIMETWTSFRGGRDRPKYAGWEKCVTGRKRHPKMRGFNCQDRVFASVCEAKPVASNQQDSASNTTGSKIRFKFIPEGKNYIEAADVCKTLGGEIMKPTTEDDIVNLNEKRNLTHNDNTVYYWIGVQTSDGAETWTYSDGSPIPDWLEKRAASADDYYMYDEEKGCMLVEYSLRTAPGFALHADECNFPKCPFACQFSGEEDLPTS